MHTNILRTASQKKSQGSESSPAKSNMIDFAPDIYFVSKLCSERPATDAKEAGSLALLSQHLAVLCPQQLIDGIGEVGGLFRQHT